MCKICERMITNQRKNHLIKNLVLDYRHLSFLPLQCFIMTFNRQKGGKNLHSLFMHEVSAAVLFMLECYGFE